MEKSYKYKERRAAYAHIINAKGEQLQVNNLFSPLNSNIYIDLDSE